MKLNSIASLVKTFVGLTALAFSFSARADFQLTFTTYNASLSNPVFDLNGTTRLSGDAGFMGQLFGGADANSLIAMTPAASFLSVVSGGAGFIQAGTATGQSSSLFSGSVGVYQLKVWDSTGGFNNYDSALAAGKKTGLSVIQPITFGGALTAGGGIGSVGPDANLHSSFLVVVPEPATLALGILGAAGLLMRRRKH